MAYIYDIFIKRYRCSDCAQICGDKYFRNLTLCYPSCCLGLTKVGATVVVACCFLQTKGACVSQGAYNHLPIKYIVSLLVFARTHLGPPDQNLHIELC